MFYGASVGEQQQVHKATGSHKLHLNRYFVKKQGKATAGWQNFKEVSPRYYQRTTADAFLRSGSMDTKFLLQ